VRALAAHDHPRALGPAREVERFGQLGDLPVSTLGAVLVERRDPTVRGQIEDCGADGLGEVVADREADAPLPAEVEQLVAGARRVDAQQQLDRLDLLAGDLLERRLGDVDLVGGGIRAGVARAQLCAQRLARLVEVGEQRVKAKAALEGPGGALLVGVARDQRGVEVDRHLLGRHPEPPRLGAGLRVRGPQAVEPAGLASDRLDDAKRRGVRGDGAEQRRLIAHRAQVGQAVAAVGEHHR